MCHHLTDHCDRPNHSFALDAQHGFNQKHSTQSNLIKLRDFLDNNIDFGNNIDVITIDYQKLLTLFHTINSSLNYLNMLLFIALGVGWTQFPKQ